jgi:hypothetical protein
MRAVIILVVVLLAGLFVYNYATTGRFSLLPRQLESEETRHLNHLEDRFLADKNKFEAAERAAAVSGMDLSAEADSVRSDVQSIEMELRDLRPHLGEEGKRRADALQEKIDDLKGDLR